MKIVNKVQKKRNSRRQVWLIVGVAVIFYFGMAMYFHSHFFPKTTLNGRKTGWESPQKVMDDVTDEIHSYV